ncbi:MAG TPA: MmcQ/YjbR family DNA-binding protein [Povalibacter sp.]|nr:MmcQ/YjbR family DNA-binding protein [Povalibacter sp.]
MVRNDEVIRLAMSLPETEEHDHWGHRGFRVGPNTYAVLWPQEAIAILRLSKDDQHALLSMDPYTFTVDQWAEQGWTKILLKGVTRSDFAEQLERAWRLVASKSGLKALEAKRAAL